MIFHLIFIKSFIKYLIYEKLSYLYVNSMYRLPIAVFGDLAETADFTKILTTRVPLFKLYCLQFLGITAYNGIYKSLIFY